VLVADLSRRLSCHTVFLHSFIACLIVETRRRGQQKVKMRSSVSKSGGHNTIEQDVTEDAKLAELGYEQGTAIAISR
jgi:hypothetical protein